MSKRMWFVMILTMAWLSLTTHNTRAQEIVLQLAVPEYETLAYTPALLSQFEAQNPGVRVQLVTTAASLFERAASGTVDDALNAVTEYASSADVLMVNSMTLSPLMSRAGLYLNLAPLVSSDTALYASDFFPAAWQAAQWDGGFWALPNSFELSTILYDRLAFDALNLAYPNERWTLNDFAEAARALAQHDSAGNVSVPGITYFSTYELAALLRSLLSGSWYDANNLPQNPQLTSAELGALLDTWAQLEREGVVGQMNSGNLSPLMIAPLGFLPDPVTSMATPMPAQRQLTAALLPGGTAAAEVQGFALSSGSAYPELAYTLARFLSSSGELSQYAGAFPAQRALLYSEIRPEGFAVGGRLFAPEVQPVIEQALESALSPSELRYSIYIQQALELMRTTGSDGLSALALAQTQADSDFQSAEARRGTTIVVNSPNPALDAGEITLRFGIGTLIMPVPNSEGWQRFTEDFAANDPQVGEVVLHTDFTAPENFSTSDDCFYLPYNALPRIDTSSILALDPFLSADPDFTTSDVVGGAMQQVQRDNLTWALPVNIQPAVLRYDAAHFEQAGLPLPAGDWTATDFQNALIVLRPNASDPTPFVSSDGTALMLLIAAYGGVPIDYRTVPPTVNFSDPATIEAIRQVLDLARTGYISYSELATANSSFTPADSAAITTDTLNGLSFFSPQPPRTMVSYPRGSAYNGVSYTLGTAYISATAQNVDACYRFIAALAQHAELFGAMPARSSYIAAQGILQGEDAAQTYQQLDDLLRQPNTLVFPALNLRTVVRGVVQWWLFRAFDDYVLRGLDLATALTAAEDMALAYQQCAASTPDQAEQCATAVDPTLGPLFEQFR